MSRLSEIYDYIDGFAPFSLQLEWDNSGILVNCGDCVISKALVTLDITMPEMDGIQALKKIKEADAGANVIMCSAMGQQAMVIEAIQNGAKDFIVKPFQADRVLEAVKKVIG